MNESSKPRADAFMPFDGNSSDATTKSDPVKRSNPYTEETLNIGKRCKIDAPLDESTVKTKQYFPIASLTPIFACPAINGILTKVSDWITSRNQVKFLTFRLRDESGEIGGIAFDPMGTDFHNNFKLGARVIVEKAKVEPAKAGYQAPTEPYRLMINKYCVVQIKSGSPVPLKPVRKMIKDVEDNSNERDVVDVVGILEDVGEVERNFMREIRIVDESETSIIITLWDNSARNFNAPLGSVIAAYRVAVRFFKATKLLRTCQLSELLIDPPIDDTRRLKEWYGNWNADVEITRNSDPMMLTENTVPQSNDNIADKDNIKIVDNSASTSPSRHRGHFLSISKLLEITTQASVATTGRIVEVQDLKSFVMKTGSVDYGRQLTLQSEDKAKIIVQVMGIEVITNDIPCPSFAFITNAKLSSGDTKKLICEWKDLQINCGARELERLLGISVKRPECKEDRREQSPNIINEVIDSSAKITQPEAHVASSTFVASRAFSTIPSTSRTFVKNNFTPITVIKERIKEGEKIDLVGLVVNETEPTQRQTRAGNTTWMRELTLVDEGLSEIEITVWGGEVSDRDIPLYSVITGRNVIVRDYKNHKTLSCLWMHLRIDPNIPQAESLKKLIANYTAKSTISKETENSIVAGPSGVDTQNLSPQVNDPLQQMVFTTITEILEKIPAGSKCNIIGTVVGLEPPKERPTKTGQVTSMRVIIVADDKNSQIDLTVWGAEVAECDIPLRSVILAENAIVREYNDEKTLTCLWKQLQMNPDIPQAAQLKKLDDIYKNIPKGIPTNFTTIVQLKKEADLDTKWNIIGIVMRVKPIEEIKKKNRAISWIKRIKLRDENDDQIEIAVWNMKFFEIDIPLGSIIAVKNASVSQFEDCFTLNTYVNCVAIDPNIPAAERLRDIERHKMSVQVAKFRLSIDDKCGDYTPIDVIKRRNTSEKCLNTFGLVVKVNSLVEVEKANRKLYLRKCILRGMDRSEIQLNISATQSKDFDIPMYSTIIVRDAFMRWSKDKEKFALNCRFANIDIDVDSPETKGLKEAALNVSVRLENSVARNPNKFIGFKTIKEKIPLGTGLDIIGLVVDVVKKYSRPGEKIEDSFLKTVRATLRDKECQLIVLNIRGCSEIEDDIKMNSVIVARDAVLRLSSDEKILWCLWDNTDVNPKISEVNGFKKLANIPYERDFMLFTTIAREISLMGSKMDIIGQVVNILPWFAISRNRNDKQLVGVFVLRNEIEFKLHILKIDEFQSSSTVEKAISLNTVIAAKKAMLVLWKKEKVLRVSWQQVIVNPIISKNHRGTRSLRFIRIKEILMKAKIGDKVGILAVVTKPPRRFSKYLKEESTWYESDDDEVNDFKIPNEDVILFDSSRKTINMTISVSIAETLRENSDRTIVIQARNVKVCEFDGRRGLACTEEDSWIEVNPKTKQAMELREWYDGLKRKKVRQELPITPINIVLDGLDDENIASILGILIKTEIREVKKDGMRFMSRTIRIIDESEEFINLLLWDSEATEFNVSLYSVILVRNFCIYTENGIRFGASVSVTNFIENPSDEKYVKTIESLKNWFDRYQEQLLKNPNDVSAAASIIEDRSTSISNDNGMREIHKENNESSKLLSGTDDCSNKVNLDFSKNSDVMNHDSASPDIFADC